MDTLKRSRQDAGKILQRITWDYAIPTENIEAVIRGKQKYAGYWDFDKILIWMIETLSWYELLALVGQERLKKNLSPRYCLNSEILKCRQDMNELAKYYEENLYPLQDGPRILSETQELLFS